MSQHLTLEISEQIFVAIQRQASAIGVSPAHLAATLLQQQFAQVLSSRLHEAEKDAARSRFKRHLGTLNVDQLMSLDNERINAALVGEYATTHEQE